ncbi:MAG: discoidin domain-containing protein [Candidatus Omnitrophica bacterium]|jgi:hypothetical protein|nr:discoidin domain-containing protein [Candidatus Omnitrophota bacterium]
MAKIRMLTDNLANAADTVVTASSSDSEWPIANLQNIWPTYYHKTSSLGAPDFWAWDLGSALPVSYVVLWNHNIRSAATVKLQADDSPDYGSLVEDITLVYGTHRDATKIVYRFSSPVTLRYWRIIATDAGNPDGYHRAGHAFLGVPFQPRYSYARKSGAVIDPSTILLSDGGQPSVYEKDAYETFTYEFSAATPADLATLIASFKVLKKGHPFFLIEDDADRLNTIHYVRHMVDFNYAPMAGRYKSFSLPVEESR